jgi:hypothetical protein
MSLTDKKYHHSDITVTTFFPSVLSYYGLLSHTVFTQICNNPPSQSLFYGKVPKQRLFMSVHNYMAIPSPFFR